MDQTTITRCALASAGHRAVPAARRRPAEAAVRAPGGCALSRTDPALLADWDCLPEAAAGGSVSRDERGFLRLVFSRREWALAVPLPGALPGASALRAAVAALPGAAGSRAARGPAVVRVPDARLPPELGAVVYYRQGRAVLYCPASQLTEQGAGALSAIAERASLVLPHGPRPAGRTVTVTPVAHARLLEPFHPAAVLIRPAGTVLKICSGLVTPGGAAAISAAWTAQARLRVS